MRRDGRRPRGPTWRRRRRVHGGFLDTLKKRVEKFQRLGFQEQDVIAKVVISNPANYQVLTESHDIAIAWSAELANQTVGPRTGPGRDEAFWGAIRGGPADAARHCFWSARLASKLGYNDALLLVTTHEMTTLEDPKVTDPAKKARNVLESAMDMANNAVGLQIGTKSANASDDELKKALLEALDTVQLLVLDKQSGGLVPSRSIVP